MIDYIYLFLYRSFEFLAKVLPTKVMNSLLRGLSSFAYWVDKKHHHIINANLKLAFGDSMSQKRRDEIGKRVYYNLLQIIIGFMKRGDKTSDEILKNIEFKNEHILKEYIDQNKKIIFVTGHYSNWELLPLVITAKFGIKLVGVGRKLDSKLMDKILFKNREKFGVEMVYRKGAIKNLLKALKNGKAVGLLLDQHLGAKQGGIEVEFFGHKALHSPSASILARSFDIAVIPAYISTDDYINYTVIFYEPLSPIKTENKEQDIKSMTQAQAKAMEDVIRAKPDEWFWVHKRWKGFYPEIYERDKK
jgi:KDO2-lipid IV(A) lauroyltransferase